MKNKSYNVRYCSDGTGLMLADALNRKLPPADAGGFFT